MYLVVCAENTGPVWLLPSQRDGQVEDREHHGAAVVSEQVSYDGGRDGGVAGLSDPYQSPGEHKQPVVLQRENKGKDKTQDFWSLFPHQLLIKAENSHALPSAQGVLTQ